MIDTAEKVWLAVGAGLIINSCSMQGFEGSRDSDGAIKPSGRWPHSMCEGAARYTTASGRKLVLIENSWGPDQSGSPDWSEGPYFADQPWGSFYVDLDVLGDMADEGDTFGDTGYVGDAIQPVPPIFTSADIRGMVLPYYAAIQEPIDFTVA